MIKHRNNAYLFSLALLCTSLVFSLNKVEFEKSMEQTSQFNRFKMTPALKKAKVCYDTYFIPDVDCCENEVSIPKIIHQVWLGSPLPEKYIWLRDTWIKNHPDWEYRLWTDKEVAEFGLTNKKLYDVATNYGEKSDIVRYEVLYRFGGLYVDTDFECLQPFDTLHHCCDFYTGLGYESDLFAFVALIGSRPNHPILKLLIDGLKKRTKLDDRSINTIQYRTGPWYFSECIQHYMKGPTDRVVLFPATYFYPWPCYNREENSRAQIEQWLRPESMAIHHWHVSWYFQQ